MRGGGTACPVAPDTPETEDPRPKTHNLIFHVATRADRTAPRQRRARRSFGVCGGSLCRLGRTANGWISPLHRPTRSPHELLDGLRTPPHSRRKTEISRTQL